MDEYRQLYEKLNEDGGSQDRPAVQQVPVEEQSADEGVDQNEEKVMVDSDDSVEFSKEDTLTENGNKVMNQVIVEKDYPER